MVSLVQDREEVSPVPGLTLGEAKQVWRNAAHPALQNKYKDLSWLAAHEILPVRAVMHSRGMGTSSICPRPGCGEPETVRHVLWECSMARDLWGMIGPLKIGPHTDVPLSGGTKRRHSEEGAEATRRGVQTTTASGSRGCPPKEMVTVPKVEQRARSEDLRWKRQQQSGDFWGAGWSEFS
ncbi:hypothetical protein SRHO_G00186920 [Serrasalmus rhombeus]